ncbi:MAG: hypothetical protein AB1782_16250 [Cyanobacteriota bacterium]
MFNSGRSKGSNIVEYVIPMAVIGLTVGLSLFYMYSSGSLKKFVLGGSDSQMDSVTSEVTMNKNYGENNLPMITVTGGSLGGTSDKPVKICNDGKCNIDFGSFALSGIPENFNEFIETAGTAGGTEKISELLYQIAKQLQDEGKIEESKQVMVLATTGHNIGAVEKFFENKVNSCNANEACLNALRDFNYQTITHIDGFDDRFYKFPSNIEALYLNDAGVLGVSRQKKIEDLATFQQRVDAGRLNYLYVDQFDKVMGLSGITNEIKGVISELTWSIGIMGEDFENNLEYIYTPESGENDKLFDPLTGELITNPHRTTSFSENLDMFNNYNASRITNFNSALICSAGSFADTGTRCN